MADRVTVWHSELLASARARRLVGLLESVQCHAAESPYINVPVLSRPDPRLGSVMTLLRLYG